MSAFILITARVKDGAKMQEYMQKSMPTIMQAGGEVVVRGNFKKSLTAGADQTMGAVVKFADVAAVDTWYASDAYSALTGLRDEAADVSISVFEAPPA